MIIVHQAGKIHLHISDSSAEEDNGHSVLRMVESAPLKCSFKTRVWEDGRCTDENFEPARISDYLERNGTFVWLDLLQPDETDLQVITEELGLHPLAVEDAVHPHQRPKLDCYDDHLFANAYDVRFGDASGLETTEISAFITPRALVTVRKNDKFETGELEKRWNDLSHLASNGVGYLVHGLLDMLIDHDFEVAQQLDDRAEDLEDSLFASNRSSNDLQRMIFELRKSLVTLRRTVVPMREVVNGLMRKDSEIANDELLPYYQDLYDHVLRVTEWTESMRDLVQSILETNLSIQSNRMNEVMKQLTSWAAIIAVPTAITGYFGQNIPYPGFGKHWGFWLSTVVMVAIAGWLYTMFRRRNWL